jgi:hypothetical protein
MSVPDPGSLTRPSGLARVASRRASPPGWGWRGLAAFWGSAATAFGVGALVLQFLGPPPGGLPARLGAASTLEPRAPETGSDTRPATATPQHLDAAGPPPPDPALDAPTLKPRQVLPAAEVARAEAVARDAGGGGDDGPPAGRSGSEAAAPVASDEGLERPPVPSARSSAGLAPSVASDEGLERPPVPSARSSAGLAPSVAPPPAAVAPAPAPSSPASVPELSPGASSPLSVATAVPLVPPPQPPPPDAPSSGPAGASATPAPASPPASTAAERLPRVTVRQPANLRTGPDVQANVIRVVPRGETLRVHNRTPNGWVQAGDAEPRGWLHTSRLGEVE